MDRYSRDTEGNLILDPNGTLDANGNPIQEQTTNQQDTSGELPQWLVMANRASQVEQENERLRRELEQRNAPTQQIPQLEEGDFFSNPNRAVDIITQRLQGQIAPLNQFVAQQQRQTTYATLKNHLRAANPGLASIEHLVDQRMAPIIQQREPTLQDITDAVYFVVGQLTITGVLNPRQTQNTTAAPQTQQNNTSATPPVNNTPVLPAHLRPSAPNRGNPNQNNNEPDYESMVNEEERRLMREQNMTAKNWVILRDTPPHKLQEVYAKIKKGEI